MFLQDSKIIEADKGELYKLIDKIGTETKDIKNSAEVASIANPLLDNYIKETKLQGESLAMLYFIKAVYGHYKPKENVAIVDKAIELAPKNKFLYNQRGMNRINIGDNAGAVKDFEEAIKLDALEGASKGFLTPSAYNNMALAESNLGNMKTAIWNCGKAIELDPKSYSAYAMRASLYQSQGSYKFALEDAIKAKNIIVENGAKDKFALQNLNFQIYHLKKELGVSIR